MPKEHPLHQRSLCRGSVVVEPILQMRIGKVSGIKSLRKRWSWDLRDSRASHMISKTLLCFPFFSPQTHLRPLCPAGSLRGLEGPGKVKSLEQVETPSTSLCCCFRTGARHTHVLVGRGLWLALAVRVRGLGWLTRWAQSWSGNCQAAKGNSLLGVHRCKLLQASAPGSPGVSLRSSGHEALKTPLPTV